MPTLADIAALVGGTPEGALDLEIDRVEKIEDATAGAITFIANQKYERFLATTRASAVIVARALPVARRDLAIIRADDPYLAFTRVLRHFAPPRAAWPAGIDPTAVVAPGAVIAADASVGPFVVVAAGVRVGSRTRLHAHVVLDADAEIGDDGELHPGVVIYAGCRLGDRVVVHANSSIGADGFGFAPTPEGAFQKIPQLGIVVVEDDVEIGANCTIDRATLGRTHIGRGVKLDNLIHIAHNVVIGENTVIAAQAGVSGSTRIGRNVMIAGQVGFIGHIEIADGAVIAAQSGVAKSIDAPGTYFGSPAKTQREAFRQEAALHQLPDMVREVRELKARIAALERAAGRTAGGPAAGTTR